MTKTLDKTLDEKDAKVILEAKKEATEVDTKADKAVDDDKVADDEKKPVEEAADADKPDDKDVTPADLKKEAMDKPLVKKEGANPFADKDAEDKDAKDKEDDKKEVKESVEAILAGAENLSEDFKSKAELIFEAAVNARVSTVTERLEESAQAAVVERVAEIEKLLTEKVDEYLEYVVGNYMTENKLVIESSLQNQIATDFLTDFKALCESHNITIPADKVDLYEAATKEIEELKATVNTLTEAAIEKDKEIFNLNKAAAIVTLAEGLADTQVEKLKKLVEDVEAKDIETFVDKAKTIKESFFATKDKPAQDSEKKDVTETLKEDTDMDKLFARIGKINRDA